MFSIVLFTLNAILFSYILFYGICLFVLPFIRFGRTADDQSIPETAESSEVVVLIPCHHEGSSLVRTVESVLSQEYRGKISVVVLLQDNRDSSFTPLQEHYGFEWKNSQKKQTVLSTDNRRFELHCCGQSSKKDKLNYILPQVKSEYIAFLDADHRAEKSWIANSVKELEKGKYAAVQSRRAPLSLAKLAQLWDSAQNHIGNELVNRALKSSTGSVFFTGTTCVFRASSLKGRLFGDCVTEDTYLSYELLRDGNLITYLDEIGSHEEVAPDMRSYLARRRRWSCGHNKTFFTLGPQVLRANIPWKIKISTLIHGLFYTVPVAVCLLLNFYALHLFVQYTTRIQCLIVVMVLALSLLGSQFFFSKHRRIGAEAAALFLLLLPKISLLGPLFLYTMGHELYYFLTSFPFERYIVWSHLFCLMAPVLLLVLGSFRIKVLRLRQLLIVVVSYPLFFFLDLYACVVGFIDFLFGKPTWAKIQRTHQEDALVDSEFAPVQLKTIRWIAVSAIAVFAAVATNDLTAYANCGEPKAYFFKPLLFTPHSGLEWKMRSRKTLRDDATIDVLFESSFKSAVPSQFDVLHYVNDEYLYTTQGTVGSKDQFIYRTAMGWESFDYMAKIRQGEEFCERTVAFTSTLREIRDNKLFLNGEEFLVKGVIPSNSPNQTEVSLEDGLAQIKLLGANVVRYYHAPLKKARAAVTKQKLLIVDQPDRSTWDDVDLSLPWGRLGLYDRFKELEKKSAGFPYSLFHNVGNELEIRDPAKVVPLLSGLIEEIIDNDESAFLSYSTFFVFLKLPVNVYGINMLDSSKTYWETGLKTIQSLNKPFYASEFGGFVAAHERTPTPLRVYRLREYWNYILKAGGFGAIIHQSHDNWAQPVVDGFNDPLSPDQPDDERGIWTLKNEPKTEKRFIEQLFSDFDYEIVTPKLSSESDSFEIKLTNRRPYSLRGVVLSLDGNSLAGPFDVEAGGAHTLRLAKTPNQGPALTLEARYTTHRGLPMVSTIAVRLPIQGTRPTVLNDDWLELVGKDEQISGTLIYSTVLRLVLPSNWTSVKVNGQNYPIENGLAEIPLQSAMSEAISFETSADGNNWRAASPSDLGNGPQRVRFKLPRSYEAGAKLILAGIGGNKFFIRYGERDFVETTAHKYRENLLDLETVMAGAAPGDYFSLLLPRFDTTFISKQDHPQRTGAKIVFEMPKVFSPSSFVVAKGD
jgi:cellulose synthase/poly-beta-1,6-N-acetylglucosamine synthase-like glycosyltransferase